MPSNKWNDGNYHYTVRETDCLLKSDIPILSYFLLHFPHTFFQTTKYPTYPFWNYWKYNKRIEWKFWYCSKNVRDNIHMKWYRKKFKKSFFLFPNKVWWKLLCCFFDIAEHLFSSSYNKKHLVFLLQLIREWSRIYTVVIQVHRLRMCMHYYKLPKSSTI